MKKLLLCALSITIGVSSVKGQTMREKMEAKLAAKLDKLKPKKKVRIAVPHDGDFSDESGMSGTYYVTSDLISSEKSVKVAKIDYDGDRKLTLHFSKDDSKKFSIFQHHLYAKKNYKHYAFDHNRSLKLYNVEPGVFVLGSTKRSGDGFIADTAKFKPVVLVKDSAMKSRYSYADAKRLVAEGVTKQEKYNRERLAASTQMSNPGRLTADKTLMKEAWKLIEGSLSRQPDWAGELKNYQMHYIYESQWGNLGSSRIYNPRTKSYEWTRKMISVLVVFRDPKRDVLTYYNFVISKPAEDASDNYSRLKLNGNSRKQIVSKKTVDAKKAEVAKF